MGQTTPKEQSWMALNLSDLRADQSLVSSEYCLRMLGFVMSFLGWKSGSNHGFNYSYRVKLPTASCTATVKVYFISDGSYQNDCLKFWGTAFNSWWLSSCFCKIIVDVVSHSAQ